MPPIHFRPILAEELDSKKDQSLGSLNDKFKELVDNINILMGVHGPVKLLNHLDLGGNRILNLGAAQDPADALSQTAADPIYGQVAQQRAMEAVGTKMLQTTRRLNDGTQQHRVSSDLNVQGTIPPTIIGATNYTSTAISITVTFPTAIQYGDQSIIAIRNPTLLVQGLVAGSYFMYPYYNTRLGLAQLVADRVNAVGNPPVLFPAVNANAAQQQYADGHVALSNGGIAVTVVGGGSGGGGGSNCLFAGLVVREKIRGIVKLFELNEGDVIRKPKGWTIVVRKRIGLDRVFIRIMLSNNDELMVTPSDPVALFDGTQIPADELALSHVLAGVEGSKRVPLQIRGLLPVIYAGKTVLLTVDDPSHSFLVGSVKPCIIAHNYVPVK